MTAKNHYRRYRDWTIQDKEVLDIIAGLHRYARNGYFKIAENGNHVRFRAHKKLVSLPTTNLAATMLLRAAIDAGIIVWGEYVPPYKVKKAKPKTEKLKPRSAPKSVTVTNLPEPQPAQPKIIISDHDNEPEEEEPSKPRYTLVTRGDFFGVFCNQDGTVRLISRDRRDSLEELRRLNRPEKIHLPRCREIENLIYGKAA